MIQKEILWFFIWERRKIYMLETSVRNDFVYLPLECHLILLPKTLSATVRAINAELSSKTFLALDLGSWRLKTQLDNPFEIQRNYHFGQCGSKCSSKGNQNDPSLRHFVFLFLFLVSIIKKSHIFLMHRINAFPLRSHNKSKNNRESRKIKCKMNIKEKATKWEWEWANGEKNIV